MNVTIKGKTYQLNRPDTSVIKKLQAWAKSRVPDPIEEVRQQIAGFPESIQKDMVARAQEEALLHKSGNSKAIQNQMQSVDGALCMLTLMFQKHQPQLSDSDVEQLLKDWQEEQGEENVANLLAPILHATPRK